ncbi:unnamed protein product [Microthlaspi erraticum]|uniref:Uncharacterized protein n=1 Tax=Microthlaspi erraticum TaxID=1685480 RepID=A0A6D2IPQ3_9BRAS|nr:unnamed protein product [Microthlaspi erraticum]
MVFLNQQSRSTTDDASMSLLDPNQPFHPLDKARETESLDELQLARFRHPLLIRLDMLIVLKNRVMRMFLSCKEQESSSGNRSLRSFTDIVQSARGRIGCIRERKLGSKLELWGSKTFDLVLERHKAKKGEIEDATGLTQIVNQSGSASGRMDGLVAELSGA